MITNTTRELINLALLNLESEKLIRSMINEAINYLNQAIIQIFELQKKYYNTTITLWSRFENTLYM